MSQSYYCRPSVILGITDPTIAFRVDLAFLLRLSEKVEYRDIPLSVKDRIRLKRMNPEYRKWLAQFR